MDDQRDALMARMMAAERPEWMARFETNNAVQPRQHLRSDAQTVAANYLLDSLARGRAQPTSAAPQQSGVSLAQLMPGLRR